MTFERAKKLKKGEMVRLKRKRIQVVFKVEKIGIVDNTVYISCIDNNGVNHAFYHRALMPIENK